MQLSDNEKRDIFKFLEAGKPLPEKYRFLLFKDDREVELVWNGKTDEVTNVVLPFQTIEQIDEPREGKEFGDGGTLFDMSGKQITGWTNKLIWGDNKLILSSLKNGPLKKEIEAQGGLKLIYIDPPFDVGADFSMDISIGEGESEESFTKKPSVIEEIAYRDTWGKGADSFIAMIYERLKLMHDLLKEEGSIYVHCDWRVSSYMRLVLDEIFGKENFLNDIQWKRSDVSGGRNAGLLHINVTDTIFWYAKNRGGHVFNKQYTPYDQKYIDKYFTKKDENGRRFQEREYGSRRQYLDESEGVPISNIWSDIPNIAQYHGYEFVDYPTQKPEALIKRIIETSTNEGDLIADFFCGSGTTLAVAEKLNRKWIGTDLGKFGIHTTRKRMIGVQRELKKAGKDFRAFEILNVGKYERENFLNINEDLRAVEKAKQIERKEKAFVQLIISAYKAEPVSSFVNIVGKKRDRLVVIGPINTPVSSQLVKNIITECKEKSITKVDILGFDYEMGLDPSQYENEGIDVSFKIIPREVFDKKAVEKGQVKFYDVAFIEASPIIKGKGNVKELSIELKDFSVSYNQDDIAEIIEGLKPGGSKIILDDGQLIKVSKDKKTEEVVQEVLTKKWSDWIDYWAVDYDFADRKEIISEIDKDGKITQRETGDYIFDNEWQEFRTKKKRNLELISAPKELPKGTYKVAIKVVDIFGNDTTRVMDVII